LISDEQSDSDGYVAVVNSSGSLTYYVIIEKRVLQRDIKDFCEAVMVLFVYHYIFNLKYCAPLTFEFIQRAILRIGCHDKKPSPRVATLLSSLNLL
jgi:hypothetical protein